MLRLSEKEQEYFGPVIEAAPSRDISDFDYEIVVAPAGASGYFIALILSAYKFDMDFDEFGVYYSEWNEYGIKETNTNPIINRCHAQEMFNNVDTFKSQKSILINVSPVDARTVKNLGDIKHYYSYSGANELIIDRRSDYIFKRWMEKWDIPESNLNARSIHFSYLMHEYMVENEFDIIVIDYRKLLMENDREEINKLCNYVGITDSNKIDQINKRFSEYTERNYELLDEYGVAWKR